MALPIPLILAAIKLIPKLRKSKTAGGNVLVGAVMTILSHFGVEMSIEVVSAIFIVANGLLRILTNKSLSEK